MGNEYKLYAEIQIDGAVPLDFVLQKLELIEKLKLDMTQKRWGLMLVSMLPEIQQRFVRKKSESMAELNKIAEFDRSLNKVRHIREVQNIRKNSGDNQNTEFIWSGRASPPPHTQTVAIIISTGDMKIKVLINMLMIVVLGNILRGPSSAPFNR